MNSIQTLLCTISILVSITGCGFEVNIEMDSPSESRASLPDTASESPKIPGGTYGAGAERDWPIILTFASAPPGVKSDYPALGVEEGILMTAHYIDPENTGRWARQDLTRQFLADRVTPDFDGFICLNWEGKAILTLKDGPSNPAFESTVQEYVDLISYVRAARPHARVGVYMIPIRYYWKQTEDEKRIGRAYQPILDASNVVFPSVYDFYNDNPERDIERHSWNVKFALELAGDSPVILFTWHRYHGSNKTGVAHHMIPRDEYVPFIKSLMQVSHEGKRPAGVAIWHNDMQWVRLAHIEENNQWKFQNDANEQAREVVAREKRRNESNQSYLERIARRTICLLNEAVRSRACEIDY